MILDHHPDCPGQDYGVKKFIGYWAPTKSMLDVFLNRNFGSEYISRYTSYPNPQDFIDLNWDPVEKEKVAEYLDDGNDIEYWMGYSYCRFTSKCRVDGVTDKSDGEWIWPAGFSHYVRKHNVKPPVEFIQKILNPTA